MYVIQVKSSESTYITVDCVDVAVMWVTNVWQKDAVSFTCKTQRDTSWSKYGFGFSWL